MLKILLFPFALLYDLVTAVRNYLYDTGKRNSVKFEANVISVGNLTVGGTGKTPHVEYLIRLLKGTYKVATLSRGYGRKSKGFIIADKMSNASIIGDEPYQYYNKFGNEIIVTVGEDRVIAIPSLLMERPETEVILLDDAYQHRGVRPLLNILLSDYNRPFYEDCLMPAGRLRESRKGANRADIVVVTKCPQDISKEKEERIAISINKFTKKSTPIFYSSISYGTPLAVFNKNYTYENKKVLLFTGLANPMPFEEYIKQKFEVSEHLAFKDHYFYKLDDILGIIEKFNIHNVNDDHILMTTEKDMVKLLQEDIKNNLLELPIFYIPIEVYLLKDKKEFDDLIITKGVIY